MKTLKKYQRLALPRARKNGYRIILAMDPGTGKTTTARTLAEERLPALILCRRDDFMTWLEELEDSGFDPGMALIIDSGKHKVLSDKDLIATYGDYYEWTLCTYDLLRSDRVFNWIKRQPFQIVLADESHLIKRWQAERTKRAVRSTRHVPGRIAMTGTMITNEVLDVWSQALFVDDGATMGNNWWKCRNEYYIKLQNSPEYVQKRNAKELVAKRLAPICYSVRADDVLDLPPQIDYTVEPAMLKSMPMSPKQRKHYEDLMTLWETELEDGTWLELSHVVARLQKLQQIANGFVYDEEHRTHQIDCPKLDAFVDFMKTDPVMRSKKKVVVWCSHTATIDEIADRVIHAKLGVVLRFYGKASSRERDQLRKDFVNTEARFFIAQVDMGVGMNELVCADTVHNISRSFKVVSRQQSLARTRRIGSERHERILVYDWITEGTFERQQLRGIRQSISVANWVLNQLKRGKPLRSLIK